jgi:predicted GNAT superfamily acetyltransferase
VKSILADNALPTKDSVERISLPANLAEIKATGAAADVQSQARDEFRKLFAKGYVATRVESVNSTVDYVLEPSKGIAGLHLPKFAED